MASELEKAKNTLFGDDNLNVADIKLFPGTNRDITSEQIAEELNRSLSRIVIGENNQ